MRTIGHLGAILLALAALPIATGSFHELPAQPPDRVFALAMSGTTFNGMHGHELPVLEAFVGERVRFELFAMESHTFHLHGHPWRLADGRFVDVFLVDPDTPHAFEVTAGGADGHAGEWMFHCHIQDHMDEGMWGILRVHPAAARELPAPVPPVPHAHEAS